MARTTTIHHDIRLQLLGARRPVSATELASTLRVNRTTIARAMANIGIDLLTMGATRSTRYLLRRNIRNIGNRWPIYRINDCGQAAQWAELQSVHERGWLVNWTKEAPEWGPCFIDEHGMWCGFPFFLTDSRPQGFLGRLITNRLARLIALPEDLRFWSDDDALIYLQMLGDDQPGDIVVGEMSLRHALAGAGDIMPTSIVLEEERAERFPQIAAHIAQNAPSSSAGGEQPKFITWIQQSPDDYQSVLVKYTAPMDQTIGLRWADLLACEFHAHEVLSQSGHAATGARLLDAGGRRFLEVPRFDRKGPSGRHGVVSLFAVSTALEGLPRDWNDGASMLARVGLLDEAGQRQIRMLHSFGELIGNTDMHSGNLSFFLENTIPWRLTPSYDMLPMLWAPSAQGEMTERNFTPSPPLPAFRDEWQQASVWAVDFWQRVANDIRISAGFRPIAEQAHAVVNRLRNRF